MASLVKKCGKLTMLGMRGKIPQAAQKNGKNRNEWERDCINAHSFFIFGGEICKMYRTEDGNIVYSSAIEELFTEYYRLEGFDGPDDPKAKKNKTMFAGALMFIQKQLFRGLPDIGGRNTRGKSIFNKKDGKQLHEIADVYIQLCFRYDLMPSITGFSLMTGIPARTFADWEREYKRFSNAGYATPQPDTSNLYASRPASSGASSGVLERESPMSSAGKSSHQPMDEVINHDVNDSKEHPSDVSDHPVDPPVVSRYLDNNDSITDIDTMNTDSLNVNDHSVNSIDSSSKGNDSLNVNRYRVDSKPDDNVNARNADIFTSTNSVVYNDVVDGEYRHVNGIIDVNVNGQRYDNVNVNDNSIDSSVNHHGNGKRHGNGKSNDSKRNVSDRNINENVNSNHVNGILSDSTVNNDTVTNDYSIYDPLYEQFVYHPGRIKSRITEAAKLGVTAKLYDTPMGITVLANNDEDVGLMYNQKRQRSIQSESSVIDTAEIAERYRGSLLPENPLKDSE